MLELSNGVEKVQDWEPTISQNGKNIGVIELARLDARRDENEIPES